MTASWEDEERSELEDLNRVGTLRKYGGAAAILSGAVVFAASNDAKKAGKFVANAVFRREVVGASLLVLGAGCLLPLALPKPEPLVSYSPTHRNAFPLLDHESAREFDFKVLNKRWGRDIDELEDELGFRPFWFPKRVRKIFDAARRKEREKKREALLEKEEKMESMIREDLEDGKLTTREVLLKLSKRVYVIDFSDYDYSIPDSEDLRSDGSGRRHHPDTTPEWVAFLRDTVSFLCQAASRFDEVLIRLCSPGGTVSEYGLAASQLNRLRKAGIKVTVCIDTVAASGGYLMAACADQILAAPFALVGSIGVVAELPNFHRLLQKYDVDYMLFTAGEYKRTVHTLAETTEAGMARFKEQLDDIHKAFKDHIIENRGAERVKDIDSTSTGEAWLASQALQRGLVDELLCSDEYLDRKEKEGYDLIQISLRASKPSKFSSFLWDYLNLQGTVANLGSYVRNQVDGVLNHTLSFGKGFPKLLAKL